MRIKQEQRFDIVLPGIVLLSAFFNIFNIWKDTYANSYYTAAVTSMLQSFHNFFYASFDPAGFVTVDKPPVAFWIQTIFAYIFGVHGWSVILPQALAGVGSVLLMYYLVKPTFGKTAARLASLVLAGTPIAVAVSRTNNIDSLLVFTLLLATGMLFRAVRTQKPGWVVGAWALIGVGFNMKMLQAYMVVPAFYLLYLLAFKNGRKQKPAVLVVATLIMVGVSASWAVVVDSTPPENRPYIGSSQTNSVRELAFGYNGISRLTGMNKGGAGTGAKPEQPASDSPAPTDENNRPEGFSPADNKRPDATPGAGGGGASGPGGGGMFGTGTPGPLRLFKTELSGQISWLLPLVAVAGIGLLAGIRRREPLTAKQQASLFWLAWLIPGLGFFSVAGFFHHYYMIMLAPAIAALTGAGGVELFYQYRNREGWKKWLLPGGLLTTTVFELYVLLPYQAQIGSGWLIGLGAAGSGLSLALFLGGKKPKLARLATAAGMLVLLAAPLYWAATPLWYGDNAALPQAGPRQSGAGPRMGMGDGPGEAINTKLLDYVTEHNTGEKYLLVTTSSHTADTYIIETGKAVIAMGGFSGSDPILTVEKLAEMVNNREVKYFLLPGGSGFGGRGGNGSKEVTDWIIAHSTEVSGAEWQPNYSPGSQDDQGGRGGPLGGGNTLYEIKG